MKLNCAVTTYVVYSVGSVNAFSLYIYICNFYLEFANTLLKY